MSRPHDRHRKSQPRVGVGGRVVGTGRPAIKYSCLVISWLVGGGGGFWGGGMGFLDGVGQLVSQGIAKESLGTIALE